MEVYYLCAFAALAGFIDSVAGGGGLIQLPALLIFLPHQAVAHLLGTNKLASIAGTSVAACQYSRHVKINWGTTLPATFAARLVKAVRLKITGTTDGGPPVLDEVSFPAGGDAQ